MSTLNAFQVLAKKKLVGLAADKVMKDDKFAIELVNLLIKAGCPREELLELLKEFKESDEHNKIQEKSKGYVYNRFSMFDENLNWRRRLVAAS